MAFLHEALGFHQRRQRLGRELACLRLRYGVGFCRRNHAVDQPYLHGRLGHERLAQQQRLCGPVVPHHLRHQQAGGRLGAQAQVDEGHGKGRIVSGVHQVAMEQQGGAHTDRRAADCSDQRLRELGNALQKPVHR